MGKVSSNRVWMLCCPLPHRSIFGGSGEEGLGHSEHHRPLLAGGWTAPRSHPRLRDQILREGTQHHGARVSAVLLNPSTSHIYLSFTCYMSDGVLLLRHILYIFIYNINTALAVDVTACLSCLDFNWSGLWGSTN